MKRRQFLTAAAVAPAGLIVPAFAATRWSLEEAQIGANCVCNLLHAGSAPSVPVPQLVAWLVEGVRQSGHVSEIERMEKLAAYFDGHPHNPARPEHVAAVFSNGRVS